MKLPEHSSIFFKAMEIAFKTYKNFCTIMPILITLRFVKGTKALLGFTKFKTTCIMKIDGINTDKTKEFVNTVWKKIEDSNIPFTMHWGKFNSHLNSARTRNMYEENAQKWIASREKLLSPEVRKAFSNDFLRNIGLAM